MKFVHKKIISFTVIAPAEFHPPLWKSRFNCVSRAFFNRGSISL